MKNSEDDYITASNRKFLYGAFGIVFLIVFLIVTWMVVAPQYNVWAQRLAGEARLEEAKSSRQIAVQEAQASFDAADFTAKAEVRRAQGVAEANKIIADSLGGSEGYLRWRYIEMLENSDSGVTIIYIPTEAGLPILEAGRAPISDLK